MRRGVLVLMMLGFVLAGCESAEEKEREKGKASEPCASTPTPIAALPSIGSFPIVSGVTVTNTTQAGPSTVVTGFSADDLDALFTSYKDALSKDGYSVTKSEKDELDAEVNFSGNSTSGQVKLETECRDRTSVSITIRPGS